VGPPLRYFMEKARTFFCSLIILGGWSMLFLVASGISGCVGQQRYSSNSSNTIHTASSNETESLAATLQDKEPPASTSNRSNSSNRIYSTPGQVLTPTSSNTASRIYSEAPTAPPSPAAPEPVNRGGALSPQDQAASDADRALVVQIRQSMMNDTSMAAAAPSVKVTVNNGKVILAGEVKSNAEKANLGSLAQRTAGVVSVDNQLEVKATPP
jgi:osmotically-inducible protein OsmY